VVYRRELAERPRNGAALAGLDENQALRDPVGVRRILIVLAAVILIFFLQGPLPLQPAALALMGAAAALLWVRPGRRLTILVGAGVGCRAGRHNGTPIGATANVITVALSGKTHTPITTPLWLRSGLPVMIATCAVASVLFGLIFGWMSRP
jgi:Na+/H+ antiporter NhaD/arsenite permease-like protein